MDKLLQYNLNQYGILIFKEVEKKTFLNRVIQIYIITKNVQKNTETLLYLSPVLKFMNLCSSTRSDDTAPLFISKICSSRLT